MRKEKGVLPGEEPGGGLNSFPEGKGCPRRSSHLTLAGSAGRGRGGARRRTHSPAHRDSAVPFLPGALVPRLLSPLGTGGLAV